MKRNEAHQAPVCSGVNTFAVVVAVWMSLQAGIPAARAVEPVKLYHWPYLKFTTYRDAQGVDWPNGDIDWRRAFYWGRVIGCDGVAFNIRGLTEALEEGNWFEPVYRSTAERRKIFGAMRRFQSLYARYGCRDNFLHLHAHPPLEQHPVRATKEVAQWRTWVLEGMRQRAELLKEIGVERLLIDLEFARQQDVSQDEQFWYDLGRDIAATVVRHHPGIRIGFYPGLYYHMSREPPEKFVLEGVAAGDLRHALLKGLYDARGENPLWHFSGYTYSIVDGTIAEPGVKYVWDLSEHVAGTVRVHRQGLGPDVEFMPGRWEMGATHHPGRLFWGLFKQPNLSLAMMRRDYGILLKHTRRIGVWDHGWSWDPAGSGYKRFSTDAELAAWKAELAKIELSSHYHRHLKTNDTWQVQVKADAQLQEKLRFFNIARAADGAWLVSGKLAPRFTEYVNLAKELTGKDRVAFPLHNNADVELARDYQRRGFFLNQDIVTVRDERWPTAAASMQPR